MPALPENERTPPDIERALKKQPSMDAVISGARTAKHPFAGGADSSGH